jgi:hypothetical protein
MLLAATLASVAIVTQDQTALRNAPRDAAAAQAVLWEGDTLEVRGERLGYLQVYDHRRERAGYVLASQVRTTSLQTGEAPALLAVLRFLKDTPGDEALGIAYAAAYLKAAPAAEIGAEPFDALGSMADRLARRAAQRQGSETIAAHLEVAAGYGVRFMSYEQANTTMRLCYDGEAFRRVFALAPTAEQRARAAWALTRHDCIDPALRPRERAAFDLWRSEVLERVDTTSSDLAPAWKNRIQLRRAGVWSAVAYAQTRQGQPAAAAEQRALDALAAVDKSELDETDGVDYAEAAMRVGATRWAAEPVPVAAASAVTSRPSIVTEPGQPGETCVLLVDAQHGPQAPLARRCTYGVAWAVSASTSPNGRAVALAVQPLPAWRELWIFRAGSDGWTIDVLPPAAADPDVGYAEFAGWVPGGDKFLVAREARAEGRIKKSFEVTTLGTLAVDKQASTPALLALFGKWQDPAWKRTTVSVR